MMHRTDLAVDEFLRRVRHMPDIEAEEQIVMRQEQLSLQIALITKERRALDGNFRKSAEWRALGQELHVLAQDGSPLRDELKQIRSRRERLSWQRAVRACFGDDGYEQCRVWMAANEGARA